MKNLLSILFLFAVGCSSTQKIPEKIPDVVVNSETVIEPYKYVADWDPYPRGAEYTGYVIEGLELHGQRMLNANAPSDIAKYCKNWQQLNRDQKKQVFVMLLSAMSKRESNFNTMTEYKESFSDAKGLPVISRGLFQLSPESANQSAYKCGITKPSQLHDPRTNIYCAIKIEDFWVASDNRIGSSIDSKSHRGCGRYWSVCRSWPDETKDSQKYIRSKVRGLEICK